MDDGNEAILRGMGEDGVNARRYLERRRKHFQHGSSKSNKNNKIDYTDDIGGGDYGDDDDYSLSTIDQTRDTTGIWPNKPPEDTDSSIEIFSVVGSTSTPSVSPLGLALSADSGKHVDGSFQGQDRSRSGDTGLIAAAHGAGGTSVSPVGQGERRGSLKNRSLEQLQLDRARRKAKAEQLEM